MNHSRTMESRRGAAELSGAANGSGVAPAGIAPAIHLALALGAALALAGCATAGTPEPEPAAPADGAAQAEGTAAAERAEAEGDTASVPDSVRIERLLYGRRHGAWTSTYEPLPSQATLIRDATVMTAAGEEIEGGDVLLRDGRIAAVGRDVSAPPGAEVIDASGRFVTPGIIDTHSHMGVYPDPEVAAHSDGNEATDPTTPGVWAMHSVWPQDPSFTRALAAGVTTVQVLPGSANLIGGRGITLKLVPSRSVQGMMFPDAPMALKMACGENPKRVYDDRGPSTRMGNVAGYRRAFIEAERYRDEWDEWLADRRGDAGGDEDRGDGNGADGDDGDDPPERDLGLETLAAVLRGDVLIHNHCYRADEMVQMLDLAKEFGFHIRSFHHGVEAYKIRDYLARENVGASVWVDWWGFKMEAFDAVPQNLALLTEAGARAILHTDDDMGVQKMNQDAARAMWHGRRAGIDITRDDALRWITANPAWALGIGDRIGTIEEGKNADVVIWSGDPFSVYSKADQVFIDGALVYDRTRRELRPTTDFELGILPPTVYDVAGGAAEPGAADGDEAQVGGRSGAEGGDR